METMTLNGQLTITAPDGFHEMDEAERSKLNFYGEPANCCISDPDRHIIITAAWKTSGFAALVLSARENIKKMEQAVKKPMAPYGYKLEEFFTDSVGGVTADGFRYSYTAQEVPMNCEIRCVKKGKTFYYIHCYMRTALLTESRKVIREMLTQGEWR